MTNPRFNIEGEQLQSLSSVPSFSSFVFFGGAGWNAIWKRTEKGHTLFSSTEYCIIDRECRRPPQAAQPEPPPQPEPAAAPAPRAVPKILARCAPPRCF